jgi:hypothetical protein
LNWPVFGQGAAICNRAVLRRGNHQLTECRQTLTLQCMVSLASCVARDSSDARRVLVVDDNVDSADIVAQALLIRGHETRVVYAISETRHSGTFPWSPRVDALFRDPTTRLQRERTRINLHESCEVVRYWTTALGCTEAQLRTAVNEVGVNSDDVRRHLRR